MKTEKAKEIVTARNHYELNPNENQWFEKSERGGSWNLWQETGKQLLHLKRIPSKSVLWVVPLDSPQSRAA